MPLASTNRCSRPGKGSSYSTLLLSFLARNLLGLFRKFTSKIREIPAQIGKLIKANLSLLVQLLVKVLYCCVCLLCDSMSGLPENHAELPLLDLGFDICDFADTRLPDKIILHCPSDSRLWSTGAAERLKATCLYGRKEDPQNLEDSITSN